MIRLGVSYVYDVTHVHYMILTFQACKGIFTKPFNTL